MAQLGLLIILRLKQACHKLQAKLVLFFIYFSLDFSFHFIVVDFLQVIQYFHCFVFIVIRRLHLSYFDFLFHPTRHALISYLPPIPPAMPCLHPFPSIVPLPTSHPTPRVDATSPPAPYFYLPSTLNFPLIPPLHLCIHTLFHLSINSSFCILPCILKCLFLCFQLSNMASGVIGSLQSRYSGSN